MKAKPTPERVLKSLDKVIGVSEAHDDFSMGPDVTLKKLKDARAQLDDCTTKIADLKRQLTEQTDLRNDCAKAGNELVVRTRKGVLAFFGPDSTQYSQAGGTRASDRKKPVRQTKKVEFPKAA